MIYTFYVFILFTLGDYDVLKFRISNRIEINSCYKYYITLLNIETKIEFIMFVCFLFNIISKII